MNALQLLVITNRPAVQCFFVDLQQISKRPVVVNHLFLSLEVLTHRLQAVMEASVAIVDVMLDSTDTIRLCEELHKQRSELPIAALFCCTSSLTHLHLSSLLAAGVGSLLDLQTTTEETIQDIFSVAHGIAVLHLHSNDATHILLEGILAAHKSQSEMQSLALLNEDDRKVAKLVARGLSDCDIGHELYLSRHTVKHRVERLRDQLGLSNRTELAAWAGQHGLYSSASLVIPVLPTNVE